MGQHSNKEKEPGDTPQGVESPQWSGDTREIFETNRNGETWKMIDRVIEVTEHSVRFRPVSSVRCWVCVPENQNAHIFRLAYSE
jgi:hypothetical protein